MSVLSWKWQGLDWFLWHTQNMPKASAILHPQLVKAKTYLWMLFIDTQTHISSISPEINVGVSLDLGTNKTIVLAKKNYDVLT